MMGGTAVNHHVAFRRRRHEGRLSRWNDCIAAKEPPSWDSLIPSAGMRQRLALSETCRWVEQK
jgi:hypothetical protein